MRSTSLALVSILSTIVVGCSSCEPSNVLTNDDDSAVIEVVEPTVTWEDCGGNLGDHACDFTFKDQSDEEWSLYDHHGTVMVLDFSAVWCGYCQVAAAEVQTLQDHFDTTGEDFLWVTILIDDATGNPPDLSVVQEWANTYGIITSPVLQGDRSIIDTTAEDGYPITSWPMFLIVDEDLIIESGLRGWSQELLFDMITDALAKE